MVGNITTMRHSAGNGLQAVGWTRNYDYETNSNRLIATYTGNDRSTQKNYAYDAHGSIKNLGPVPDELVWDYNDMIHAANLGGCGIAFYNYGGDKQRSRKRIEKIGIIEDRIYLEEFEVYRRWEATGVTPVETIETHHLFSGSQRLLIAENVVSTNDNHLSVGLLCRYQYSNHLGSVGLELNDEANIISYEEYHPYGTTAYQAKNVTITCTAKRYRYTGLEREEETGLAYHSARYYLPWLGRWGSADPIGIGGGANLYKYCKCTPLNVNDINGKLPMDGDPIDRYLGTPIIKPDIKPYQESENSVDHFLEEKAENAIIEHSEESSAAWNFLRVGWKMFGAENVSVVADKGMDSSFGDVGRATLETVVNIFGAKILAGIAKPLLSAAKPFVMAAMLEVTEPAINVAIKDGVVISKASPVVKPAVNELVEAEAKAQPAANEQVDSALEFGQGDIAHFTDAEGVRGITGLDPNRLTPGEMTIVTELNFTTSTNDFLQNTPGNIFVTELPELSNAGTLERIGVFESTGRQDFVVGFSRESAFANGIRVEPSWPERSIFTIPSNSRLSATGFYYTVLRR